MSAASALIPVTEPERGLKLFLQQNGRLFGHGPEALAEARVIRDSLHPKTGMHSISWQQQVGGIPVFDAILAAHTTRKGELVNVTDQFVANPRAATGLAEGAAAAPVLSAEQAVAAAAAAIGVSLAAADVKAEGASLSAAERLQFYSAPGLGGQTRAGLAWLPVSPDSLRLCWDVILTGKPRGEMFRVLVDATTGSVWIRRGLTFYDVNTNEASYRVYTSDSPSPLSPGLQFPDTYQPPLEARIMVTHSALSTNASPAGWIDGTNNTTLGNNVDAHLDRNDNDIPDPGSRPVGTPDRVFDYPLDLATPPTDYSKASVVQLFYLNNWMHDRLYDLGFTEDAGNFQSNNFERGGNGADAVQADCQDGGSYDNANFATPPDGMAPRMQMYLFSGPSPMRDGSLDAEVVLHEYTHGLSSRLVGSGIGMNTLQAGGMGEGWSDFYALSLLSNPWDDPHACYASGGYVSYMLYGMMEQNYYYGIRRYPYSTDMRKNPLTFKDIDPAQADPHSLVATSPIGGGPADEVHNMGEVWCAMLWEARAALVDKHGGEAGNGLMLQLVTDGMKLCPPNPNYIQSRDAIIQADEVLTGGENYLVLWTAFAKRGLGFSALSPDSSLTLGLEEAYDLPDDLRFYPASGFTFSGYQYGPFNPSNFIYEVENRGTNALAWDVSADASWLTFSITNGSLAPLETAAVELRVNAAAEGLSTGLYTTVLGFLDRRSGVTQKVNVNLWVKEIPGTIELLDTIAPAADTNLPFETVRVGAGRTESVTVRNTDLTHDLVLSSIGFGVYLEDFEDGLAQDWRAKPEAFWTVTQGAYKAEALSLGRFMQSTYKGDTWADCHASVLIDKTGDLFSPAMMVLRASEDFDWNTSKGSAYLVASAGPYYMVLKMLDGRLATLQPWTKGLGSISPITHLETLMVGTNLLVALNDTLVYWGFDESIPDAGNVGLMAYSGDFDRTVCYFDDVEVDQVLAPAPEGISPEQAWNNAHPSDSASPARAPAGWEPPAYAGGGVGVAAGIEATAPRSGPYSISGLPALPCRLPPGAGFTFNVSFLPELEATFENTIVFRSNDANQPEIVMPVSGRGMIDYLTVSPAGWLPLQGRLNAAFSEVSGVFTIHNEGPQEFRWSVSNTAPWLILDPREGAIAGGGSATVTATVNSLAAAFPEGVYSNAVVFYNLTAAGEHPGGVAVKIAKAPRVGVTPLSFDVTNAPGLSAERTLTIGNSGDSNLVWSLRLPGDALLNDTETWRTNWAHSGFKDRWHLSNTRAASGTYSWYCGNWSTLSYENYMNAYLESPPFKLGYWARFNFSQWFSVEPEWDMGYVEITTNDWETCEVLTTITGNSADWQTESLDLSAYGGKTVKVRFRFKTDGVRCNYEGWYVDDVTISPVQGTPENRFSASSFFGELPPGGSTNVNLTFSGRNLAVGDSLAGDFLLLDNDFEVPSVPLPFVLKVVEPLWLQLPGQVMEGTGVLVNAAMISTREPAAVDWVLSLSSSDPAKVGVPLQVTIPAGSTNAYFDLSIGNDLDHHADSTVTVAVAEGGFGLATLVVREDDAAEVIQTPVVTPSGAFFLGSQAVAIGCGSTGVVIRWTWDNPLVTETSTVFEGTLTVTNSGMLRARAFRRDAIPSATVAASFRLVNPEGLTNGASLSGLAAAAGEPRYFAVDVPPGLAGLRLSIEGGSGECDMIVRYGGLPSMTAYDYYPALPGNRETVTAPNPAAGTWYVLLSPGSSGFDGVTLKVAFLDDLAPLNPPLITPAGGVKIGPVMVAISSDATNAVIRYTLDGADPTALSPVYIGPVKLNPAPLLTVKARASLAGRIDSDVASAVYKIATRMTAGKSYAGSGAKGSEAYYAFTCPPGATRLTLRLTGGTGNANLYVKKGGLPTLAKSDFASTMAGNNELITIDKPAANKVYYIMVYGKSAFRGSVLKLTVP